MGLTAATYLGENTVPILTDLVAYLRDRTGLDLRIDDTAGTTSEDARARAADIDLLWMCGRLTMSMIREGALHHQLAAAPVLPGETDPVYHSVIVSRPGDGPQSVAEALAGTVAINELESWSGHHGLRAHVAATAPGSWFARTRITGSHRASITAVIEGTCDVAAIDSSLWRYLGKAEPERPPEVTVIDRTIDWPVPPISVSSSLPSSTRHALSNALLSVGDGRVAGLQALRPPDLPSYDKF